MAFSNDTFSILKFLAKRKDTADAQPRKMNISRVKIRHYCIDGFQTVYSIPYNSAKVEALTPFASGPS
jgi:hypothetical protein